MLAQELVHQLGLEMDFLKVGYLEVMMVVVTELVMALPMEILMEILKAR